jgi:hypothetical protein
VLRIKHYHSTIERQAAELADWNRMLEVRVAEQMQEFDRLSRLERFLSPQLAELLVSADGQSLLETHRRQIAVACFRLCGFESLAETAAPEEVMALLTEYLGVLGQVFIDNEATVGLLAGDRVTAFLNDPLPVQRPAEQATTFDSAINLRTAEVLRVTIPEQVRLQATGFSANSWAAPINSSGRPRSCTRASCIVRKISTHSVSSVSCLLVLPLVTQWALVLEVLVRAAQVAHNLHQSFP